MKPTAIATATATDALPVVPPSQGATAGLEIATSKAQNQTCSIVLRNDQITTADTALSKLSFHSIKPAEIALIGHEAEVALTQTLDSFLSGITRFKNPGLFALFDRLQDGVANAKLTDLLKRVQSGKLGWRARVRGLFSKKALAHAAQAAYQSTCDLVSGHTNTLSGVMQGLERELTTAMTSLLAELQAFDALQATYKLRIDEFAIAAAVTQAFVIKSRTEVEQRRTEIAGTNDPMVRAEFEEMEQKLALLESRALALEGVYSKLPADRMVIQQIESAGVQTLQETATTATTRFSSIKTTLIALHGALQVKGVQQLTAQHAALDRQLAEMRTVLMKEVVTTAANTPGDNRLTQATQLKELIKLTGEIQSMVSNARKENAAKFTTAQQMFADARRELTTLSVQPTA